MEPVRAAVVLRARIGDEACEALMDMVHRADSGWRDYVLEEVEDRFEKRLTADMGLVRIEMNATRVEILRWSFLFWIGQLVAMAGLLAYMK